MVYLPTLSDQTKIFFLSLGMGFLLGILYDVFRIIRMIAFGNRKSFWVQDILYFLVCTVVSFLFFLAINNGNVRGYELFGEALGWLIYYFSFGTAAIWLSEIIVSFFKRFFGGVLKIIISPFRKLFCLFHRIFTKIVKKTRKILKKIGKKLKFHLKFIHKM